MEEIIKSKIEQIKDCLLYKLQKESLDIAKRGLYSGEFGLLLFLSSYSKYANDPLINTCIHSFTNKLLTNLVKYVGGHTFCSGFSGVLYLFDYLHEEGLLDVEYDESRSIIENYIISAMERDLYYNKYDFLHGVLGCGYYFLKKKNNEQIERIVQFLCDTSEPCKKDKTLRWMSVIDENGKRGYNIALSHGIASIVLFLSHLVENGKGNEKIDELLQGGINYILAQELNVEEFFSFFPSHSMENEGAVSGSRLAWCYGDLGVAYSLWYAGKVTDDKILKKKALDIFVHSTKRLTLEDTGVIDAGLCHGSAGVAMIFRRMYLETGDVIFSQATNFWIKRTLNFAHFNDGLAGYKTYQYKKWESDYSLLTGISGIGLLLLSYIENDQQSWDKMFLL